MANIEIRGGIFRTTRFGDKIEIPVPVGGHVEIRTDEHHTDVELREKNGSVHRRFRLANEGTAR